LSMEINTHIDCVTSARETAPGGAVV
jgi:hypothetical protein